MAETLRSAGLADRLGAVRTAQLPLPNWKPHRDSETKILNPKEVEEYSTALADAVEKDLAQGYFPLVVGGDCTILLGSLLALRRAGNSHGLYFIDGHADFYEPGVSPSGETADMELRFAVGRGPDSLANLENKKPLVEESKTVLFGFRDEELIRQAGGEDVRTTAITCLSLSDIQLVGFSNAVEKSLEVLLQRVEKFWIHIDLDVLDDISMPAVDYRMPGGLSYGELVSAVRRLLKTEKALGMTVSIFNPTLDWDGTLAKRIVEVLGAALRP